MNPSYRVIGLMSGTSLDGLDIAYCEFNTGTNSEWSYSIVQAETIPFSAEIRKTLVACENESSQFLAFAHVKFGTFMGKCVKDFIERYNVEPDFIASHGHTIFHRPGEHMTLQIGSGAAMAAYCGIPVVCDFRTTDVALGGQGAPLVPIGDKILFRDYSYCLNLGGFSNISFDKEGKRIAFDICPFNMVLNYFAQKVGKPFDDQGKMASSGTLHRPLLEELNALDYYFREPPKSLGKEWVLDKFLPVIDRYNLSNTDFLNTISEHLSIQIGKILLGDKEQKALVTGGGALNNYVIARISNYTNCDLLIPDLLTISFKEALVFAFLGLLRWTNQPNCLASVTGAGRDSTGGCIYV